MRRQDGRFAIFRALQIDFHAGLLTFVLAPIVSEIQAKESTGNLVFFLFVPGPSSAQIPEESEQATDRSISFFILENRDRSAPGRGFAFRGVTLGRNEKHILKLSERRETTRAGASHLRAMPQVAAQCAPAFPMERTWTTSASDDLILQKE